MDIRINEWRKLKFVDPEKALPQLRMIQLQLTNSTLEDKIKNLRTRALRQHREGWEAAIFCYGMGKMIGVRIYVTPYEASDYDAVAVRGEGDAQYFTPIQIKEVVPSDLNPGTDINKEIAKLSRYPVSNDTIVAIHVARAGRLDLSLIEVPRLNIGALWLFGACAPNQSKWFIAGDLLDNPRIFEFEYPIV
jgi:hypothetical protein